jgi:long-chain acyl-CoA synthetase
MSKKEGETYRVERSTQAMKLNNELLDAWEKTRRRAKDSPAMFDMRGEIARTFHQIETDSREFETKLGMFAVGCVIAIQIGNHPAWPSIFLAALRRKLVVLPLEVSITPQQRDAALKICRASAIMAVVREGKFPEIFPSGAATSPVEWSNKLPALLKITSGTTGVPRAIRFRSHQLLADCNQICDTMGITGTDLNFGVIPLSHSYGFSNLLTPLIARGVPMVLSNDTTPRAVLDGLEHTKATIFPGMPVLYQAFCELSHIPPLPNLQLCISAGAPLPTAVAKKFRDKFKLPIHSFYGASECGGICYDSGGANLTEGFVGTPMKGLDIEIADPTADSSQIQVRSMAVGDDYFPDPDEDKLGQGIFTPDDLLARVGAGFKIVGRISDIINVAGKKVNPAEVEAHLLRYRGVRQVVVFGRESAVRNQEVVACLVADADVRENDLLEFCRRGLSSWQAPKRIFIVDTIPANQRGKISRRELARRFAA